MLFNSSKKGHLYATQWLETKCRSIAFTCCCYQYLFVCLTARHFSTSHQIFGSYSSSSMAQSTQSSTTTIKETIKNDNTKFNNVNYSKKNQQKLQQTKNILFNNNDNNNNDNRLPSSSYGRGIKLIRCDKKGLQFAGKMIRDGKLVAFPTETVYGLGANAFDLNAITNIFIRKKRPLTDPLIVHVPSLQKALELYEINNDSDSDSDSDNNIKVEVRNIIECLGNSFWPGPLTIIYKCSTSFLESANTAEIITAGTMNIGIRCPSHPVALSLLHEAQVPVVAPSANRFGHVSPTMAKHVIDDFEVSGDNSNDYINNLQENLFVIDGESESKINNNNNLVSASCKIGIESTVAKINPLEKQIEVYRAGAISTLDIENALEKYNLTDYKVCLKSKIYKEKDESISQESPGQLLKHYSPDCDTYMLKEDDVAKINVNKISKFVVIDFSGRCLALKQSCLAYYDLSSKGDLREAASNLFKTLRLAESTTDVKGILITDLRKAQTKDLFRDALTDRIYRATSGKIFSLTGV